jgi:hypothetical protein
LPRADDRAAIIDHGRWVILIVKVEFSSVEKRGDDNVAGFQNWVSAPEFMDLQQNPALR